jgi:FkbM family methyltransferase
MNADPTRSELMLGVNTPFFLHRDNSIGLSRVFESAEELGVVHHRIPFVWAALQRIDGRRLVWNDEGLREISTVLRSLPHGSRVLGVLTNPPRAVAEWYFDESATLPPLFDAFCAGCAERFPSVESWEIWNEPNASDFYLSSRDGDVHRPWSAGEFVEHVVLPGARAIRRVAPDKKICVGGVAENGIVGHTEKSPAISNRLPNTPRFQSMRSKVAHGQLYFVPGFALPLLERLGTIEASDPGLIDAVALHPYPYLGIHRDRSRDLVNESCTLTADFLAVKDRAGLADTETWITEVGCRSLDVANRNAWNEDHQAEYLRRIVGSDVTSRASRLYWYHLVDTDYDLRQEKSFGLLDHAGSPKKAYFEFQRLICEQRRALPVLRDRLDYGSKYGREGFNANLWTVAANNPFAFVIGATTAPDGAPGVLVSPGRSRGTWLELQSRPPLMTRDGGLSWQVELACPLRDSAYALSLQVVDGDTEHCRADLHIDAGLNLSVVLPGQAHQARLSDREYPFATPSTLTAVTLDIRGRDLAVRFRFGELSLVKAFRCPAPLSTSAKHLRLRVTQLRDVPGYLRISEIVGRSASANDPAAAPQEIGVPDHSWTFLCPRHSQIFQDEWVLRATRFRTAGYFVEIGGHDGVANSNTAVLERNFGWRGLIVEPNPKWFAKVCENRRSLPVNCAVTATPGMELDFVDAGAVGGLVAHLQSDIHADVRARQIAANAVIKVQGITGDALLERYGAPAVIDYVSIDTEGSEFDVVRSIDWAKWNICLVTIEHGGNQEKRAAIGRFLEDCGYQRVRVWFEDWFFHIGHLARVLGVSEDEASAHMAQVNSHIRYNRRTSVIEAGLAARRSGDRQAALALFNEAMKSFYPDNVHAFIEAANELEALRRIDDAIRVVETALAIAPNHAGLLRKAALLFGRNARVTRFVRVLERLLQREPTMMDDQALSTVVRRHARRVAQCATPDKHPRVLALASRASAA